MNYTIFISFISWHFAYVLTNIIQNKEMLWTPQLNLWKHQFDTSVSVHFQHLTSQKKRPTTEPKYFNTDRPSQIAS